MRILPTSPRLISYLRKRGILKKYEKQLRFLGENPRYPGLNVELLEPRKRGIYSFRIDKKYRALFIFRDDLDAIEVISITSHYR